MAAEIVIETNSGILDLYQGAETTFFITRQIHDLHNFQTRNSDFTSALTVPPTQKNLDILGAENTTAEQQGVTCSITMGGVMVASIAFLYLIRQDVINKQTSLEVQVLYGNFGFFNEINPQDISTINWADLAIQWELTELVAASSNTTNLVYAQADWFQRGSQQQTANAGASCDVNTTGFFLYVEEIMRRIIQEAGFTMVLDANVPSDFHILALACPVTAYIYASDFNQASFTARTEKVLAQAVSNATERGDFDDAGGSALGLWDNNNEQWVIDTAETYIVEIAGIVSHAASGVRPDSEIRIVHNGATVATFSINGNVADVDFQLKTQFAAVPTDLVWCEIQSFATQTTITLEGVSNFYLSIPGGAENRLVQPADYVPKIDRKTFLTSILNIYNLVMLTDDIARTVTIKSFNTVFTGQEQDLTTRVDVSGKLEIIPGLDSVGRDSHFRWIQDDIVRRDSNLTVRFDNDILAPEKVIIQLPYSSCDNSVFFFNFSFSTELNAIIPMCSSAKEFFVAPDEPLITTNEATGVFSLDQEVDFQAGSWFTMVGGQRSFRVIEKTSATTGILQFPFAVLAQPTELNSVTNYTQEDFTPRLALMHTDGGSLASSVVLTQGLSETTLIRNANSLMATWFDRLTWPQLAPTYYAGIIDALETPQVVKIDVNISAFDFINLDHLRPIYMDQLNAFYYLNKIEQFKLENKTRLELIRMSTITQ